MTQYRWNEKRTFHLSIITNKDTIIPYVQLNVGKQIKLSSMRLATFPIQFITPNHLVSA